MLHVYKIGGKLSLVFYIVMLYQLWHLCQYGGLRSHALRLMVAALGFAVTFILWLAARKRRQKEGSERVAGKKVLYLELAVE